MSGRVAGSERFERGWWRFGFVLVRTGSFVAAVSFVLAMAALLVDALFARQGPGEVPKIIGVLVLMPVALMGSVLLGLLTGAAAAPFFVDRSDPIRRRGGLLSVALWAVTGGFVAWALRDFWLPGR